MREYGRIAGLLFLILIGVNSGNIGMAGGKGKEVVILGNWTKERVESVLHEASAIREPGERAGFLSEEFMDTPYKENTLIGDTDSPEILVINLREVDCFTFIDYVEAMRLSRSAAEFKANIKRVRYASAGVAFENRNHFFTDWRASNPDLVDDVTREVGAGKLKKGRKTLNVRRDGTFFLLGIEKKQREITYIPAGAVDDAIIRKLKTGDYVGIYTRRQGLDVSHVGIIIKKDGEVYFRHASSHPKNRRVVDNDFRKYISDKPGIVVLRPKDPR